MTRPDGQKSASRGQGEASAPPIPDLPADAVLDLIRVMWSVDHELQSVSKRMVTHMGLTAPQRLAVRFIGLAPGITLGALAEVLHLHPGTVTGIVRRLEEAGLVARTRSTEDSRRVHVSLTAEGRLLDRRRRGTVEAAVRRAVAAVTPAELESASRLLRTLARELAAEDGSASGPRLPQRRRK